MPPPLEKSSSVPAISSTIRPERPVEERAAAVAQGRQGQLVLAAEHVDGPGDRGEEAHRDRGQHRVGGVAAAGAKATTAAPAAARSRRCAGCRMDPIRTRRARRYLLVITTMPRTTPPRSPASASDGHSAPRRPRPAAVRAAELGEARRAPDRDREDEGHPDPGDQRGDDRLEQLLGVDDRRPTHQPVGRHRRRRRSLPERRAKAAATSERAISETSTGPSAPVPKIRVTP